MSAIEKMAEISKMTTTQCREYLWKLERDLPTLISIRDDAQESIEYNLLMTARVNARLAQILETR